MEAHTIPDDETDLNLLTDQEHDQRLADMLERFWETQNQEMNLLHISSEQVFKNHNDLPLARIKRIMKSDEDVRMISAEAPVLFAKACEIFVLELSIRSWGAAEKCKRRNLQKEDVEAATANTDIFDFLVNMPGLNNLGPPPASMMNNSMGMGSMPGIGMGSLGQIGGQMGPMGNGPMLGSMQLTGLSGLNTGGMNGMNSGGGLVGLNSLNGGGLSGLSGGTLGNSALSGTLSNTNLGAGKFNLNQMS